MNRSSIDAADRIARLRARLFPLVGIGLIALSALASGHEPGLAGRAAWLALWAGGFMLVVTGGVGSRAMRALTDDESARANRAFALLVGFSAGAACAAGLYVVVAFVDVSTRQALHIVLSTAIAAPLISFGALERRALE